MTSLMTIENINDISINVHCIKKKKKSLSFQYPIIDKMDKMLICCTYDNGTLHVDQESASWARNLIDTRNNTRTQEILLQ